LLKNFVFIGHRDNVLARRDSIFPFAQVSISVEQNVHTTFSFPHPLSEFDELALGMFKDSAIILDAIRRQFLTRSATAAMFTSIRVHCGRPPLSSSSTSSLPSWNRDYHL